MFNFFCRAKSYSKSFCAKDSQKRQAEQARLIPREGGQAMISAVVFFIFVALVIISGLASPTVREYKIVDDVLQSKRSFFVADSGIEDVYYRFLSGLPHLDLGTYDLFIGSDFTTLQIDSMQVAQRTVSSTGNANGRKRIIQFVTDYQDSVTFQSGLQFGRGGLLAQGTNSLVIGSITSTGPVLGTNFNSVQAGGAVSSGNTGLVDNLRFFSTGHDVHSHSIMNALVSKDAYYTDIINSTVNGTSYPNSPDAPAYPLPISDKMISKLEQIAEVGGVYSGTCPYNINSGTVNLGPIKIPCSSWNISGTATVRINGPIWVTGNINVSNTAVLSVGPLVGNGNSVPVIADNLLNRSTSSKITLNTASMITGMGSDSYVMLIAQNNDSEGGGSQDAVNLISTGGLNSAVLVYAPHGHINVQSVEGSAALQVISGYKATLTAVNSVLAGRPSQAVLTFPANQLNIWENIQWKEI